MFLPLTLHTRSNQYFHLFRHFKPMKTPSQKLPCTAKSLMTTHSRLVHLLDNLSLVPSRYHQLIPRHDAVRTLPLPVEQLLHHYQSSPFSVIVLAPQTFERNVFPLRTVSVRRTLRLVNHTQIVIRLLMYTHLFSGPHRRPHVIVADRLRTLHANRLIFCSPNSRRTHTRRESD